jgi:DNA-binding PadR family transcriptional regulator
VWIGAVYTTLERAEGKGLVSSRVAASSGANGRSRKVYELEPDGKAALGHAYNTWLRMTRGIKPKLESL